jgi:hypothetical protein
MPKMKVFAAQNLKNCLPNLPLETGRGKKKIKVFFSRQFCASLNQDEAKWICCKEARDFTKANDSVPMFSFVR